MPKKPAPPSMAGRGREASRLLVFLSASLSTPLRLATMFNCMVAIQGKTQGYTMITPHIDLHLAQSLFLHGAFRMHSLSMMEALSLLSQGQFTACRRIAWPSGLWIFPDPFPETEEESRIQLCAMLNGKIIEYTPSPGDIQANDWLIEP